MKLTRTLSAIALATAALASGSVFAANPNPFQGVTFSTAISGPVLPNFTYHLTLGMAVDGGGLTGNWSTATQLEYVALKMSNNYTSVGLTAAPGGPGLWTLQGGGLNENGCSGAGAGYFCYFAGASADGDGFAVGANTNMSFGFDVRLPAGVAVDYAPHVKVGFTGEVCKKDTCAYEIIGDLYSTAVPVPEPEAYVLMLAGLGVVGFMVRRRRV